MFRELKNQALENFGGCAVVISHDRWFFALDRHPDLAFEGDSKVVWFEGNYSEYEEDRRKRLGAAADQPHRIKYRQLTERNPIIGWERRHWNVPPFLRRAS